MRIFFKIWILDGFLKSLNVKYGHFFQLSKKCGHTKMHFWTLSQNISKILQGNPTWYCQFWFYTLKATKCKKLEVSKLIPSIKKISVKKSRLLVGSVFKIDFLHTQDRFFKKKVGSKYDILVVVSDEQRKSWKNLSWVCKKTIFRRARKSNVPP